MNTNSPKHFILRLALLTYASVPTASALYNPTAGRCLSRDPMEEHGGLGLYVFVGNAAISSVDPLGLFCPKNGSQLCQWRCRTDQDCCRCMVFCEGEGSCVYVVYHVMKNRQRTSWPDFRGESDFCGQAKSPAFQCGPCGKLGPGGRMSGEQRFDQCCAGTLPAGRNPGPANEVCRNPGPDPTGGAQFFFTGGQTPSWMTYNVQQGNCARVTVTECSLDIYKCTVRPVPRP